MILINTNKFLYIKTKKLDLDRFGSDFQWKYISYVLPDRCLSPLAQKFAHCENLKTWHARDLSLPLLICCCLRLSHAITGYIVRRSRILRVRAVLQLPCILHFVYNAHACTHTETKSSDKAHTHTRASVVCTFHIILYLHRSSSMCIIFVWHIVCMYCTMYLNTYLYYNVYEYV